MNHPNWYERTCGWIPRPVRRIIVFVIGGTLLLIAFLGIILPIMPGWIFLPLALAILALEFAWAGTWLLKIRRTAKGMQDRVVGGFSGGEQGPWPARCVARIKSGCASLVCRLTGKSAPGTRPSAAKPIPPASRPSSLSGPALHGARRPRVGHL